MALTGYNSQPIQRQQVADEPAEKPTASMLFKRKGEPAKKKPVGPPSEPTDTTAQMLMRRRK